MRPRAGEGVEWAARVIPTTTQRDARLGVHNYSSASLQPRRSTSDARFYVNERAVISRAGRGTLQSPLQAGTTRSASARPVQFDAILARETAPRHDIRRDY